jgi:lysyl-tRNA synthetase class 2
MLEELISERRKKLEHIREKGIDPYPADARRTARIGDTVKNFQKLSKSKKRVQLAARIAGLRDQGGVLFLDVQDESGRVQAVLKKENLKDFSFWKEVLDRGDFVEIGGSVFLTKRGEKSVEVKTIRLLTKSLRPLPTDWYGLDDVETRLRRRYVDLAVHPEVSELFKRKSLFWQSMRDCMRGEGFMEVETPVFEQTPGGADATPFVTHLNALDIDLYLRISLELYQKRLLVGGFEKVFEIGRVFRNEGIDAEHLQDYTALEFYWAYADYKELMKFVEKLYKTAIKNTFGTLTIASKGQKVNWGAKWKHLDYSQAFKDATGIELRGVGAETLYQKAIQLGLEPARNLGIGRLIDLIYKKTVRPHVIQPTFLVNHPVAVSPLAKRHPQDPEITQRIQVLAYGTELGNGWSELNDPLDQRQRFEEQMQLRAAGDEEAQMMDEDFVEALEYGMPPAAGFGLSERLFSVLADKPVRETVFFPLMRPK